MSTTAGALRFPRWAVNYAARRPGQSRVRRATSRPAGAFGEGSQAGRRHGSLAQLVEQLAFNQLVVGSNPTRPTIIPGRGSAAGTRARLRGLFVFMGREQARMRAFIEPLNMHAKVAELVDALGLGPSGVKPVRVRVSPFAPMSRVCPGRQPASAAVGRDDRFLNHCEALHASFR